MVGQAGAPQWDAQADAAPWQAPTIESPEVARDVLLMGRKLRQLKKATTDARRRIDAGQQVDGIDYDPSKDVPAAWAAPKGGATEDAPDAHPTPELVAEVHQEIRTSRARSFLGDVDAGYETVADQTGTGAKQAQEDLDQHLSWGTNQAITEHAQTLLGDATIDRQTIDLLGAEGSAKLLAWQVHQHRGEHVDAIGDALDEHHLQLQDHMIPEATEAAREAYEHAHEIHAGMADATSDLSEWKAMNDARIAKLDEARRTLGRTLGHLEATAALNAAMRMGPPEAIVTQLGQVSETRAAAHAKSAGLEPEDYEIDGDGMNTWLTIKPSGFAKMVRPYDGREARAAETVRAIKTGEHDEDGWMPEGFAKRSDPKRYEGERHEEHARPFDYGLKDHDDMQGAMSTYIAQRVHDGWRPLDVIRDLQRTAHHAQQIAEAHGDGDHDGMGDWLNDNPEPSKSDPFDMFGGGGPTQAWKDWDAARREAAAAPHVQAFHAALEHHAPSRASLGGDSKLSALEMAERYGPGFEAIATEHAASLGEGVTTLHSQQLDEDHAHDATFRALARHPAAVGAFKPTAELSHDERAALRESFYRYLHPKAGEAGSVPHPDERIAEWDQANPEPEREEQTIGMFGAMGMSEKATPQQIAAAKEEVDRTSAAVDQAYAEHAAANQAVHAAKEKAGQQELGSEDAVAQANKRAQETLVALQEAHAAHDKAKGAHFGLEHQGTSQAWRDWKKKRNAAMREYQTEHGANEPPDWDTYVATHGSASKAYEAVQDMVRSRFIDDFRGHYEALSKSPLRSGVTAIRQSDRHRIAFDPDWRDHVRKTRAAAAAMVHDRDSAGRFIQDQVRAKRDRKIQESRARKERQTTALDEPIERARVPGVDERRTIGRSAEAQLAELVGKHADVIDPSQPFEARTASFSGEQNVKRQRAIKMLIAQRKIGLFVGTGGGKTSIALGALSQLRSTGRAKRGLMAVPSIVQGQFGSEALSFIDPDHMRWHARPGESREDRLAALANPDKHAVVVTHQSLRDDVTHLVAKHLGIPARDVATKMTGYDANGDKAEAWSRSEMDQHVREALEAHGAGDLLHFLAVDEGDIALNRKGKRDSHMARVIDSLMRNSQHGAMMTGTPVKNDVSELYDQLAKVAHHKYNDEPGGVSRAAFMRRYGSDPAAAGRALRSEMDRYSYTAEVDHGLRPNFHSESLDLSSGEQTRAKEIAEAYAAVANARRLDTVDVDAAKRLAPHAFEGVDEEGHQDVAAAVHSAAAPFRDHALNHAFNVSGGSAKIGRIQALAKQYKDQGRPGVIFARNLASVDEIRGALEGDGHKVITLTGRDSSKAKAEKRGRFNNGGADIIVLSDAGATGANLQHRASWLIHHDVPQTYRTWKQRTARIVRGGQSHENPDVHTLGVKHEWEDRNRSRLDRKKALHESMFDGQDAQHDESGLAGMIRQKLREAAQAKTSAA